MPPLTPKDKCQGWVGAEEYSMNEQIQYEIDVCWDWLRQVRKREAEYILDNYFNADGSQKWE